MNFSKRLDYAIQDLGITQKQAAIKSGIPEATLCRYVSSERYPTILDHLPKLAHCLGVSTDYLLGATNIPDPKAVLPDDEAIVLRAYHDMSDYDKAILFALIDRYISPVEKERLADINRKKEKAI